MHKRENARDKQRSGAARTPVSDPWDFFEQAVDLGHITSTNPADDRPYLKSLQGEPRFEAARLRMIEHLNRERAALGLEAEKT